MKKIFLIIITLFLIINQSLAEKQGILTSSLTTAELWDYVNKLKTEQFEFIKNNQELSKEYWELISFIKTDLTKKELKDIKEVINNFLEKRNTLIYDLNKKISEFKNVEKEKNDLILLRADIYKYLAKFVIFDKRNDFIEHIKFQVRSEKESKNLIEEIQKSQNLLDQKFFYYTKKIEQHNQNLQEKIDISITQKIKQKIDEIDSDKKYISIPKEVKNKLYDDFILQIKDKIKEIQGSNLAQNYKDLKINIFNKLIDEVKQKQSTN